MKTYKNTTQFYKSQDWANCKAQVLNDRLKDGAVICEHCGKVILNSFDPRAKTNKGAMVFHHKIYLTNQNVNDASISINPKNIAILHWNCHNEVHKRFGFGTGNNKPERKVYLVVGAPCSGKTTFVKEHIEEGDIVFDIDSLWEVLSGQARYTKPNSLKQLVLATRLFIKDQLKRGAGYWRNAYIIESKLATPLEIDKEAEGYPFNVEVVEMDATKEECLTRLLNNSQGRDVELYKDLINEYYDKKNLTPPPNF